ncbi:MAG: carbohydrate kinase family protein [Thermodesulfobacteriota bacterium]
MVLVIGEILMDVFPEYRRIGGAPFNFSYHLHHFGLPVHFISRIGRDEPGKEILEILERNEFDTRGIQMDHKRPTGKVIVHPDPNGGHRFEIVENAAYDSIELPKLPESAAGNTPRLIYFGTLIQRTPAAFAKVQQFLDNRSPQTRCMCDINLRPGCYSTETVLKSLQQADILKINNEEIETVQKMLSGSLETEEFVFWLMEEYNIEMVSVTCGSEGSELYAGRMRHTARVPEFGPIADTVGAGDAYAAVLALGYLKNWPPERILSEATAFSAEICRIQGAVPEDRSFYEDFIKRIAGETNA